MKRALFLLVAALVVAGCKPDDDAGRGVTASSAMAGTGGQTGAVVKPAGGGGAVKKTPDAPPQ